MAIRRALVVDEDYACVNGSMNTHDTNQLDVGSVRRAADLTARYGGEEFAIILPDPDLKGTAAKADQLRRQVEKVGLEHRSAPLGQVTVSMGVASLLAPPDFNPEDLVGLADQALYRAKQEGRNRIMESPGS